MPLAWAAPAQRPSPSRSSSGRGGLKLLAAVSILATGWGVDPGRAQDTFHFSDDAAKRQQEEADKAQRVQQLVSVPCRARLKSQRILLLIAERAQGSWNTAQTRYGPLIRTIDARLQALGLRTYTEEQIRKEVAQAEIDAYFRNDPDAALAASRRLAANYILRGDITSQGDLETQVGIRSVAVDLSFTLASASGRTLSHVSSHSESYSGADTLAMAETLVNEQADEIVGQLYHDYCAGAGAT
jgi:hypothetical protein